MRAIALPIVILMLTATFAGCVGGDPDGDDSSGIDMDALNQMIDNHLQDFINNTTVTVNNFYDDYDYSNTNYNIGGASFGEGVNGSISGSNMMFVAHIEFTAMDLFPDFESIDHRNNSFNHSWTYYDYLTNSERTDNFQFSCQVFYIIGSRSNNSTFQVSYFEDPYSYYAAWENEYNNTIADFLSYAGSDSIVRYNCDDRYDIHPIKDGTDGYNYNFLTIDIPEGYAIQYIQLTSDHSFYGCGYHLANWRCDPTTSSNYIGNYSINAWYEFSEGISPHYSNYYYGGWENISIDFDIKFEVCTTAQECGTTEYTNSGDGVHSIWPTSEYQMTLYYQFVPVMPVE